MGKQKDTSVGVSIDSGDSMTLELSINELNSDHFLREFTFSSNKFVPQGGTQVELADGIVQLGDTVIFLQLKQREAGPGKVDQNAERAWFDSKVLKKAKSQIRDTHTYLDEEPSIKIENGRGTVLELRTDSVKTRHAVICYRPHPEASSQMYDKFCVSRVAGFIHIFREDDYNLIVSKLVTFAELKDYLVARQRVLSLWASECSKCSERALLSHYLLGVPSKPPKPSHGYRLNEVDLSTDDWDIRGMLARFHLQSDSESGNPMDYYKIIGSLAQLNRAELREFRTRFDLALEYAKAKRSVLPWAFSIPKTSFAFAISAEITDERPISEMAKMFGMIAKYIHRAKMAISVAVLYVGDGFYDISWCYIESEWEQDDSMDEGVLNSNPFRQMQGEHRDLYRIR